MEREKEGQIIGRLAYETSRIPTGILDQRYYVRQMDPEIMEDCSFFQILKEASAMLGSAPAILQYEGLFMLAVLPLEEGMAVAGPVPMRRWTETSLRLTADVLSVPWLTRPAFYNAMKEIPELGGLRFRSWAALLMRAGQKIDVLPEDIPTLDIFGSQRSGMPSRGSAVPHNSEEVSVLSYAAEHPIYEMIREGDTMTLREVLKEYVGFFGENRPILTARTMRSICMRILAQGGSAAIRGGVSAREVRRLINGYAGQVPSLHQTSEYTELICVAAEDLSEHVRAEKKIPGLSPFANRVASYVNMHIYGPLTVRQIADHMHFHPGYVSRQFVLSSGVKLKSYIIARKMDAACRLLKYTDRSLTDISSLLGFTDQSHFQRTFRSHFGITPSHYRQDNGETLQAKVQNEASGEHV